jgi:hypothetical protein
MGFYVLFALLALCSGQTMSPTPSPSCSASPGYFCSGGSALICPVGAYCTGGSALNVSCYPVTACTVAGLSAQPPCYWNVSTLAGNGVAGFANGAGGSAMFQFPTGVFFDDRTGLLYVGGYTDRRIRVISGNVVSTFAGTGASGAGNGPLLSATFQEPTGVVVNQTSGDLFSTDWSGRNVRKLSMGVVSTVASGLGFDCTELALAPMRSKILVAARGSHRIHEISYSGVVSVLAGTGISGSTNGVGTTASFFHPLAIAVNSSGWAYVGDTGNARIRLISPSNVVTTLTGSSAGLQDGPFATARFSSPTAFALDKVNDNIYVGDASMVRYLDMRAYTVTTLMGGASGSCINSFGVQARMNAVRGVAIGNQNQLFFSDSANNMIRTAKCVPCPASFYCISGGPVMCPSGSYCPLNSVYPTPCPAGTFSAVNGAASNSTCTPCAPGTFAPATGSTSCQQCPGGHFCPAGATSWARLNCGRGNYCPDGSGTPTPCPYQVPPIGGWGALKVQGPAFLVETARCLNHCFWNFTSGDGVLSKC